MGEHRGLLGAAVWAPVVYAAAYMTAGAFTRPAWTDEWFTEQFAEMSWSRFWPALAERDAAMAPYYLALRLLPDSMTVYRLVSVVAMTGAMALCVSLARRHGLVAGFVCGVVLAANPMLLRLGNEARGYALACLGVAWLAHSRRTWAVPVALVGHLMAALPCAALLLGRRDRAPWAVLVVSSLLAAAATAGQRGQVGWIQRPSLADAVFALELTAGSVWVLAGLALLAPWWDRRTAVWWLGPYVALWAASAMVPLLIGRYLAPSALGAAVLIGVAAARAGRALLGDRRLLEVEPVAGAR